MSAETVSTTLRIARSDEIAEIDLVMKDSTREIFPRFYDARQTASALVYVASPDRTLIEDGTYFVCETNGKLVACGGWSRRDKLYSGSDIGDDETPLLDPATQAARVRAMFTSPDWTRRGLGTQILVACEGAAKAEGFRMMELMATLPGIPLYESYGLKELKRVDVILADGVPLPCAAMEMAVR